jgi:hypothetical protein
MPVSAASGIADQAKDIGAPSDLNRRTRKMVDRLASLERRHDFESGVEVVGMDELRKRFRQQFSVGPPELPRPGRVDRLQIAIEGRHREQVPAHLEDTVALTLGALQLLTLVGDPLSCLDANAKETLNISVLGTHRRVRKVEIRILDMAAAIETDLEAGHGHRLAAEHTVE